MAGLSGERRGTGKAITGASNLVFLFIVLSGLVLWWPSAFTVKQLRPITWFLGRAKGRARDFNWHHVFGIWALVPLVFVVASGVVISYPVGQPVAAASRGRRAAGGRAGWPRG